MRSESAIELIRDAMGDAMIDAFTAGLSLEDVICAAREEYELYKDLAARRLL